MKKIWMILALTSLSSLGLSAQHYQCQFYKGEGLSLRDNAKGQFLWRLVDANDFVLGETELIGECRRTSGFGAKFCFSSNRVCESTTIGKLVVKQ